MLEIVAKRAALRPTDTMVGSDGGTGYEVSDGCSYPSTTTTGCSSLHTLCRSEDDESIVGGQMFNSLHWSRHPGSSWRRLSLHNGYFLGTLLALVVILVTYLFPALLLDLLQN